MAVELKKGQKVSLEKKASASLGEVVVNLNWNQGNKKGLMSIFGSKSIDLDLGCLFELKNGMKGTVQALGNAFGSLTAPPFIALDGDDRTGQSITGETLRINGDMLTQLRRILVYTFIYEGAANWKGVDGVVTVRCPGSEEIIVRMDEYKNNKRMCAIALLENDNDKGFSVQKEISFFDGHKDMDAAFAWGLNWTPGRK